MRLHFYIKIISLFVLLSGSISVSMAETVEQFIAKQPVIRVLVDVASNSGNQAASMNVIARLRAMGFQKTIQLYYLSEARQKIINLYDLPADIGGDYTDKEQKIQFISIEQSDWETTPLDHGKIKVGDFVPLGITGAFEEAPMNICKDPMNERSPSQEWDDATGEYFTPGVPLPKGRPPCNFADMMNVGTFIRLSPYTVDAAYQDFKYPFRRGLLSKYGIDFFPAKETKIYQQNHIKFTELKNSELQFISIPVSSLQDAKNYLKEHPTLTQKNPGIDLLINAMEGGKFNILPAYSYNFKYSYYVQDDSPQEVKDNYYINYIIEVIAGARQAQLDLKTDEPLIIAVFGDYKDVLPKLNAEWAKNHAEHESWKKAFEKLKLDEPGVFSVANLSDPGIGEIFNKLHSNQILLLSVGALPKIVFDGLYTYTGKNIWPQIREGANSFNSLITTGKPHIRCGHWEIGFDRVTDGSLKELLKKLYDSKFCQDASEDMPLEEFNTLYTALGNVIVEARSCYSDTKDKHPICEYFERLKQEATKPENDRIYSALEEAIKLQSSEMPSVPDPQHNPISLH